MNLFHLSSKASNPKPLTKQEIIKPLAIDYMS